VYADPFRPVSPHWDDAADTGLTLTAHCPESDSQSQGGLAPTLDQSDKGQTAHPAER
jgi:hypothetical protein